MISPHYFIIREAQTKYTVTNVDYDFVIKNYGTQRFLNIIQYNKLYLYISQYNKHAKLRINSLHHLIEMRASRLLRRGLVVSE